MTASRCFIFTTCDVPGAVCKNVRTSSAMDLEVENEVLYWLKITSEQEGGKK